MKSLSFSILFTIQKQTNKKYRRIFFKPTFIKKLLAKYKLNELKAFKITGCGIQKISGFSSIHGNVPHDGTHFYISILFRSIYLWKVGKQHEYSGITRNAYKHNFKYKIKI